MCLLYKFNKKLKEIISASDFNFQPKQNWTAKILNWILVFHPIDEWKRTAAQLRWCYDIVCCVRPRTTYYINTRVLGASNSPQYPFGFCNFANVHRSIRNIMSAQISPFHATPSSRQHDKGSIQCSTFRNLQTSIFSASTETHRIVHTQQEKEKGKGRDRERHAA